jgi:hypothetical protein
LEDVSVVEASFELDCSVVGSVGGAMGSHATQVMMPSSNPMATWKWIRFIFFSPQHKS